MSLPTLSEMDFSEPNASGYRLLTNAPTRSTTLATCTGISMGREAGDAGSNPAPYTMNIEVMYDYVVVEKHQGDLATEGGIIIPETSNDALNLYRVVAAGPGAVEDGTYVEVPFNAGDIVLIGPGQGAAFNMKGRELIVIRARQIFAIDTTNRVD